MKHQIFAASYAIFNLQRKVLMVVLAFLLLQKLCFADYNVLGVQLSVTISDLDKPKAKETYSLFIIGNESIDEYEAVRKRTNTLESWRAILGEPFHLRINNDAVVLESITVKASPYWNYNPFDQTCNANITVEYDLKKNGEYACFKKTQVLPRTYNYQFKSSLLGFGKTIEGDPFLNENEALLITIPRNAKNIKAIPEPQIILKNETYFWSGKQGTLANFNFEFEKQISIYTELDNYISEIVAGAVKISGKQDFIGWIAIIMLFTASAYMLKKKKLL